MSFQKALSDSLFSVPAQTKVEVLRGLHDRHALDLDEKDAEGMTLLDHMAQRNHLQVEVIEFLDAIGRSDTYASPRDGVFSLMERQLFWLGNKNTANEPTDSAMARMIQSVDEQWWLSKDEDGRDAGATIVVELCACQKPEQSLAAIWKRGVATDARLHGRLSPLAANAIRTPAVLQAYIDAGANLNLPADLSAGSPSMWRPLLLQWDDMKDIVRQRMEHGAIDEKQAINDLYLKDIRLSKDNKAAMIKQLFSIQDWQNASTCGGTPAWLYAVKNRINILPELIERKKKRPDFSQRDSRGRSVWFWICAKELLTKYNQSICAEIEQTIPQTSQMLMDLQGRGLIAQIAQRALNKGKTPSNFDHLLSLFPKHGPDALFARLGEVDFSRLSTPANNSSGAVHPVVMGLILLANETARSYLTPKQRGHVLAGLVLNYPQIGTNYQAIWMDLLQHKQDEILGGIEWPQPNPEHIDSRSKSEFNLGAPLKNLSREMRQRWVVDWAAQQISRQTAMASGMRTSPRL